MNTSTSSAFKKTPSGNRDRAPPSSPLDEHGHDGIRAFSSGLERDEAARERQEQVRFDVVVDGRAVVAAEMDAEPIVPVEVLGVGGGAAEDRGLRRRLASRTVRRRTRRPPSASE